MKYLIGVWCGCFNYLLYTAGMYDLREGQERNFIREAMPHTWKQVCRVVVYLAAAVLFVFLFADYGYGPLKVVRYCLLMGGLVPIAYEDYREQKIPNRWLFVLAAIRGALFAAEALLYPSAAYENLKFTLFGAAAGGILLFVAYVISRHGIGMGDVKLFAVIGMYLGAELTYIVIIASLLIAAVYAMAKVVAKKLQVKDEIAFAPFIAIGTILILGLGF